MTCGAGGELNSGLVDGGGEMEQRHAAKVVGVSVHVCTGCPVCGCAVLLDTGHTHPGTWPRVSSDQARSMPSRPWLISTAPVLVRAHASPKMPAVGGCSLSTEGVVVIWRPVHVLLLRLCQTPIHGAPRNAVSLSIPVVVFCWSSCRVDHAFVYPVYSRSPSG